MSSLRIYGWLLTSIIVFSTFVYLLTSSLQANALIKLGHKWSKEDRFRAPYPNLWAELDQDEIQQIYDFLRQNPNFLNLTTQPSKTSIGSIELLYPNKTDAVAFLDEGKRRPDRYARTLVVHSTRDENFIADYMVGPLPITNATQILPLTYPYNSGRNYVKNPIGDENEILQWVIAIVQNVSDITMDLLGGKIDLDDPFDPDSLSLGSRPITLGSGGSAHWIEFYRAGMKSDAHTLLPQGLYFKLNLPSSNPTTWKATQWYYNGILYPDLDTFRSAWSSPNFTKSSPSLDGSWTDTEDFESNPFGRSLPPPISVQPYGPRYRLDRAENYVSWMGFSFYLSTSSFTAMSLFDIRFENERIIYHLGLQEALVHYAGDDPIQSGLEFLDSVGGMGLTMFSLVPGYDCPAYADFIDVAFRRGKKVVKNKNAICIFEYTSDAPIQRHLRNPPMDTTVSRNTYLVVRSVSTVGNYDYTIDYIFYLDGSIEVKTRASGFIFTSYIPDDKNSNEYGYRIHNNVQTSIHDHEIIFRADIDILNSSQNTFIRTSIDPIKQNNKWDEPEFQGLRNTMKLTEHKLEKEMGLNWPSNGKEIYTIQSNIKNKWNEYRGYKIMPGTGISIPTHFINTEINQTLLEKSSFFSTKDLWILKQHDKELSSTSPLNLLDPKNPIIDFEKMLSPRENIIDTDMVIYFNLGQHHIPTSSDIPNTLMHTSSSSVMFIPFNYFDQDISLKYSNGIKIDQNKNGDLQKNHFGGYYDHEFNVKKTDVEPELSQWYSNNDNDDEYKKENIFKGLLRNGMGLFG